MKRIVIIIWTGYIAVSCGLVSKYPNGQHSVYARMLNPAEKEEINESGEIFKDVELGTTKGDDLLKGTLRIYKTNSRDVFNFVEVGKWINHGRLGNSGRYHNLPYRDTTLNDNLGNSISRVVYYQNNSNEYSLSERWTSMREENYFVRHVQRFKDGVLVSEYTLKLQDFNNPKSDIQKKKIPIGERKDYSPTGQLISVKTFDDNGKLIK